ncbi:MAG: hypothetical protein AB7Q00_09235 [Phycisphaerales bacterium]
MSIPLVALCGVGLLSSVLIGCAAQRGAAASGPVKVELLGFPGCPNTPAMRAHLREALADPAAFDDVNQEKLPESDPRRGWPTPTILVNGRDLFGLPTPSSPAMGCRLYPGGVPTVAEIRSALASWQAGR